MTRQLCEGRDDGQGKVREKLIAPTSTIISK